jgi:chemosensory pili system protein ChpA (sensor histidine kinase/response regulator)
MREIEIQAETQMESRTLQADDRQFDPLEFDRFTRFQELTRLMAESVNDVATVQSSIGRSLDESDSALAAQQRLSRDLQQDLLRVRMLPFATITERMHRVVRQAARETGRDASLEIANSQVELDRSILERITAPLEHILRNAVVHGIEDADRRRALGKPDAGHIRIDLRAEGNQVEIVITDDGAGLATERIRQRAIERGLLAADSARLTRSLRWPDVALAWTSCAPTSRPRAAGSSCPSSAIAGPAWPSTCP